MTPDLDRAVRDLLAHAIARGEVDDLDRPHVVLMFDPVAGNVEAHGPYDDGYAATTAAHGLRDDAARVLEPPLPTYTIAPLNPVERRTERHDCLSPVRPLTAEEARGFPDPTIYRWCDKCNGMTTFWEPR